ncbi:MAG: tetratricopeptide repeat protein [Halanaerobiales bacterium]|nr:tetratricopeptide repeat protein [Halanaerobiales bacterium]
MCKEVNSFLDKGKKCLEKKDNVGFIQHLSIAKYIAQEDKDLVLEIETLFAEGLYKLGDYKEAYKVITELLESGKLDEDKKIELLQKKGSILTKEGTLIEAIKIFEELTAIDSEKSKVLGFGNLAWVYLLMYRQGEEDEYLEDYLAKAEYAGIKALDIFNAYTNPELHKRILINMGNIYCCNKKYNQALEIFFKVYDEGDINVLNNIASTYASLGNSKDAENYLDRAEMKALSQKNLYEEAHCYLVRGRISEVLIKDYLTAKDHFTVAFHKFLETDAANEACMCLNRIFDLDSAVNKENISLLKEKLKSGIHKKYSI